MSMLSGPSATPAAGGSPRQLVVLLHGVGADGADLINLSQAMAHALPHARFIAPNGPEPCDMAPTGYQWFSLADRNPRTMLDGVKRAEPLVNAFIDDELARDGLADHQLALLGFSQGTMTSLQVALRRAKPMAAVLGFSGALLAPESLQTEAKSKPPVLLIHGDADQVVPVQALHGAVAGLQAAGLSVQWSVRPGLPHGIDPDGIAAGAAFLASAFEDAGA
ncbi:MAG: alpha/beta fold hydrolase [Alphaproteobacteria bacterium]|nr:alpha/beta fold hydrolase [Alphaproteobacteria bacterium]